MVSGVNETITPESTEEVVPGLTCEWYFNRQIVGYKLTQVSPTLVTQWADYVVSVVENWDTTKPYLTLHDLSTPGVSLQYSSIVDFDTTNIGVTADGRKKVNELMSQHPDWLACVALNLSMSLSGQVNTLLMHRSQLQARVSYKLFYSRDKSFDWLMSFLMDSPEDE